MPATQPPSITVRIRPEAWKRLRADLNLATDAALASRLGLPRPTVTRAMNGANVGGAFIGHAMHAFPIADLRALFVVAAGQ